MAEIAHFASNKSHPSQILERLQETLGLWRQRIIGRAELARLDERELHDIGINRASRDDELRKPFWRG